MFLMMDDCDSTNRFQMMLNFILFFTVITSFRFSLRQCRHCHQTSNFNSILTPLFLCYQIVTVLKTGLAFPFTLFVDSVAGELECLTSSL